jgi:2',3'-cyclic-nucleotide 2'-phosphodiesterase (5'-nucleotidase family)
MKRFLRLVALAACLASGLAGTALAETIKIAFVQTNDIDRMEEKDGRGGFARLAAVVAEARAAGPTLFVHSGDTLSPSLLSGIDKGAHIIDILNHMGSTSWCPATTSSTSGRTCSVPGSPRPPSRSSAPT